MRTSKKVGFGGGSQLKITLYWTVWTHNCLNFSIQSFLLTCKSAFFIKDTQSIFLHVCRCSTALPRSKSLWEAPQMIDGGLKERKWLFLSVHPSLTAAGSMTLEDHSGDDSSFSPWYASWAQTIGLVPFSRPFHPHLLEKWRGYRPIIYSRYKNILLLVRKWLKPAQLKHFLLKQEAEEGYTKGLVLI